MNWGYKILIVYVLFITGIVSMVIISSIQKTDLVTTDYYDKELKYQQKIDEMARVAALSQPLQSQLKGRILSITFPNDFEGKTLQGRSVLYFPSDENKDIEQKFSISGRVLEILLPPVAKGIYELHLSWNEGTTSYYLEKKIVI